MNNKGNKLILALPKGSLQESTFKIMKLAGFNVTVGSRSYTPTIDDPEIEIRLIRAQEISRYVERGFLDAGLTGYDWIVENDSDVHQVCELVYAKQGMNPVKWVVAVPEASPIKTAKDLAGRRIATEAVGLTNKYLNDHNVKAEVEFSWGATEVKAPELVDAIVELTETGSSLRANKLRIVDTVLISTTRFIANKTAWRNAWKKAKIEQLSMLLRGALAAENKVLLKLNCKIKDIPRISKILPSLHAPTINHLQDKKWAAIETVVTESVVREIIPELKKSGAEGIIELPINKIIP